MKKFISLLLALVLTFSIAIPAFAQNANNEPEAVTVSSVDELDVSAEYNIMFLTGIGQTFRGILNPDGTLNEKYDRYNMIQFDLYGLFSGVSNILQTLKLVGQLLQSLIVDRNFVEAETVGKVLRNVLHYNFPDENGELPKEVEDLITSKPISEYTADKKKDFYRSIPCFDAAAEIGEENIYCYSASPFGYPYKNAEKLDAVIDEIYEKTGKKVVLVPMSMGATIASAYLDEYGDENKVAKVVSIVGAWDGSNVLADLVEGKLAENSQEMFYDGTMADYLAKTVSGMSDNLNESDIPWLSSVLGVVLRSRSQKMFSDLIDAVLEAISEDFIINIPSFLALVPSDRYEAIAENYLSAPEYAKIKEQTDKYWEAQKNLKNRFEELEAKGMEFYFIAGYGLEFGEASDDYNIMKFLGSSATTNSDEIIQISSTVPGATYVPVGEKVEITEANKEYVSPDGSIDLSTAYYPDRTWCFYGQHHQLEYNNTAINLALELALGNITSVKEDCSDAYYPQFNLARDVEKILKKDKSDNPKNEVDKVRAFIEENKNNPDKKVQVDYARQTLKIWEDMINSTVNNPEVDNKIMANVDVDLYNIGLKKSLKVEEPTPWYKNMVNVVLGILDDTLFKIFGYEGFTDYSIFGTN